MAVVSPVKPVEEPETKVVEEPRVDSVVGRWAADKEQMMRNMRERLEEMDPNDRPMGKLAIALVENMEITLELFEGGDYRIDATIEGKADKGESGRWVRDGKHLQLTSKKHPVDCVLEAHDRLVCSRGPGENPTPFRRLP